MTDLLKHLHKFVVILLFAGTAQAADELHLYNWGNYTPPALIEKFEKETGVSVVVNSYTVAEEMLATVEAGDQQFDVVVAPGRMIAEMVEKDLLGKVEARSMENGNRIRPDHVDLYFDPGREYSAPWLWGSSGIGVNTEAYEGQVPNSWSLVFDPPEELAGQINMFGDEQMIMRAALIFLELPACTMEKKDMKALYRLLKHARPNWASTGYGMAAKLVKETVLVSQIWNGTSLRARNWKPGIRYIVPKEGAEAWSDNAVVLAGAGNLAAARSFLNFIMAPENAAIISNFAWYDNAISGSRELMDPQIATAPEIVGYEGAGEMLFVPPCSEEVLERHEEIWEDVSEIDLYKKPAVEKEAKEDDEVETEKKKKKKKEKTTSQKERQN